MSEILTLLCNAQTTNNSMSSKRSNDTLTIPSLADLINEFCNESILDVGNDSLKRIMEYMKRYCTPVIIFVGTVGNLLSFFVFTTTHLRRQSSSVYLWRQSSSIYLASLAIADYISHGSRITVVEFNEAACASQEHNVSDDCLYGLYVSRFLSVWYVVGFTLERYIMVQFPLRKDWFCTLTLAKKFVLTVALLGLGLFSFATFTNGIVIIDSLPVCLPLFRSGIL